MKKLIYVVIAIAVVAGLVFGYDFWALRNGRGSETTVTAPEFTAAGVVLRSYACSEAPSCERLYVALAGSRLAATVESAPARAVLLGPTYSDLRNDRPFEVRILRKYFGFLWVPERTVRFDVARSNLPEATAANHEQLMADLRTALAAAK